MKLCKLIFCFVFCLSCYAQESTGRTTRGNTQKKVQETNAGKKGIYGKPYTKVNPRKNPQPTPSPLGEGAKEVKSGREDVKSEPEEPIRSPQTIPSTAPQKGR